MSKASHGSERKKGRRAPRQVRRVPQGRQAAERVELIMDTTERLLAESGYEAITTNLIAERAGVSIGSIYQYFPGREALFEALAERYRADLATLYDRILDVSAARLTWSALLDRMLERLLLFQRKHKGFEAMVCGTGGKPIQEASQKVHLELLKRIEAIFAARNKSTSAHQIRLYATICVLMVQGMLPLATATTGEFTAREVTKELKRVLLEYLTAVMGD